MHKITGLSAHHTDVVAVKLDWEAATILVVGATTISYVDHDDFLAEVYRAMNGATAEDRRYLHTVKRHILKARQFSETMATEVGR